jgi:hypothetical protein
MFVESQTKNKSSPVGATYSAPTELGIFLITLSTNMPALRALKKFAAIREIRVRIFPSFQDAKALTRRP